MNAVTYTEAQALDSRANVLQAADPSKHMILVPLSRLVLRPTGRNVRKTVPCRGQVFSDSPIVKKQAQAV